MLKLVKAEPQIFLALLSVDYVTRLGIDEAREDHGLLPKIPTQPMGYGDAEHFLKLLSDIPDSPEVPAEWVGEIKGITYRIGGTLQNSKYVMNASKTFHIALPVCFRFSVGFRFRLIGLENLFPKASQKFYGQCTNLLRYVVFV